MLYLMLSDKQQIIVGVMHIQTNQYLLIGADFITCYLSVGV